MKNIIKFYQDNTFVVQFIGGSLFFYLLWEIGYVHFLKPDGTFDWYLNRGLALQDAWYFSLWGFKTKVVNFSIYPHLIYLDGEPNLSVDTPCNGLPMMYLFSAFIAVYQGPLKRKIGIILFGVFTLYLLNMVRIIALSYISLLLPDYFYFNHKYAFQIIVYSYIGVLWVFWVFYGSNASISLKTGMKAFTSMSYVPFYFNKLKKTILS